MLLSAVSVLVVAQLISEIPEGLMNNPVYRLSQELMSLFWNFIPELILSQKRHIHMGQIRKDSGVMSF